MFRRTSETRRPAAPPSRRNVACLCAAVCHALLILVLASSPTLADWSQDGVRPAGRAVAGTDLARLLPPAGATVESYDNHGYRLHHEDGEVWVEVDASVVGSTARWQAPANWPDDSLGRLARSITAGAATEFEVSSRILGWVASHVSYELDRQLSQEPGKVLDRRTAYCTGFARLATGLLQTAGLEAREVAGYVLGIDGLGEPQGFHRWIETRYSDVGWVFSDPLYSHHYVPATYVRLGSETVIPAAGLDGLLLERRNRVVAVDVSLHAPPGVQVRRNRDRQLAAALRVEVAGAGGGLAVLEGNAERLTHTLVEGTTTFLGLMHGTYLLELRVAGLPPILREFELEDRDRTILRFDLGQLADATYRGSHRSASPPHGGSPRRSTSDSVDGVRTAPAQVVPVQAEPAQTEPVQTEPAQTLPATEPRDR